MHTPRKRFGQHFLHDQEIISRIVDVIAPGENDHLVEIGPGEGAITFPVLQQSRVLEAIELDRDLVPVLNKRAEGLGDLQVYQGDVLEFDFASLKKDDRPLRLFGNLPYNISTPLIFHLLDYAEIISDMTFMLQKEMADRLVADFDSEHYGRLSVMVQYCCEAELLFDVPPESFSPPPKVDSSIIRLVPYKTLPYSAQDEKLFSQVVKQAFSMRRKTLRNSLKGLVDDNVWEAAGIDSIRRAETLSVEDFVKLSNVLLSFK
jgi:16S rRNA (adenine1518-N6/adenine1519-N6)-dimethyltransferase